MKFIDEIRALGKGLDGPLAALCDEVIADLSEKPGKTPARVIGIPCTHNPDDVEFEMQLGDELIQALNSHLAGNRFVFSAEHFSNPFDWQKEIGRTVAVGERVAKVLGGQVKLDPSKFDKPDLAINRCLMHLRELDPALVIAGLDSEAGQALSGVLGHQIDHGLALPPSGRRLHRLSQEARTRVTLLRATRLAAGQPFTVLFGWLHASEVKSWAARRRKLHYTYWVPASIEARAVAQGLTP
jgi:hypothetical protein